MSMQHVQYMLLFLVVAVSLTGFTFYRVTRFYSIRPFLCALDYDYSKLCALLLYDVACTNVVSYW